RHFNEPGTPGILPVYSPKSTLRPQTSSPPPSKDESESACGAELHSRLTIPFARRGGTSCAHRPTLEANQADSAFRNRFNTTLGGSQINSSSDSPVKSFMQSPESITCDGVNAFPEQKIPISTSPIAVRTISKFEFGHASSCAGPRHLPSTTRLCPCPTSNM